MWVQLLPSLTNQASTAKYLLQLGRLEQCEGSFLLKETTTTIELFHIPQLYSWVDWSNVGKVMLKETTTTNSTIWESNQDLLDYRPIPNHCMLLPYKGARSMQEVSEKAKLSKKNKIWFNYSNMKHHNLFIHSTLTHNFAGGRSIGYQVRVSSQAIFGL